MYATQAKNITWPASSEPTRAGNANDANRGVRCGTAGVYGLDIIASYARNDAGNIGNIGREGTLCVALQLGTRSARPRPWRGFARCGRLDVFDPFSKA
eukprot:362772-Chlamydomonas_euryale.AAC.3